MNTESYHNPVASNESNSASANLKTKIFQINHEASDFFHACLKSPTGKIAMDYLKKRGLSNAVITTYGLGYAPGSSDSLCEFLKAKGYSYDEMISAGLVLKDQNGKYHDRFHNRVMFPIIGLEGNVIAFGGRAVDKNQPIYLNSPDTPVFIKSETLFSLNFAKDEKKDSLILVEGYIDAISVYAAGFKNVVAACGISLTEKQVGLMAKYAKNVTIVYDSDISGEGSAIRASDLLCKFGINAKIIHINGAKDPYEYIKRFGADGFKKLLNSLDIFRFVNSKDIRNHLRKINYKFNSLEAAWIIYQCSSASLNEKHDAWQKLIETMPDQPIKERNHTKAFDSLHRFLTEYMKMENRWIEDFCRQDGNAVYHLRIQKRKFWIDENTVFSSFEKCYNEALNGNDSKNAIKFIIEKGHLDQPWQEYEAIYSAKGEIMSITLNDIQNDFDDILKWHSFDGLGFTFPTPFQKGDIVWEPESEGDCKGPFVLTDICSTCFSESVERCKDVSDMNTRGYFQSDDGDIYDESMWNYMDLEYYRGKFTGKRRILKALSNYVKGKIDIALMLKAYRKIITDEYAAAAMPKAYTEEGMILAGLADDDIL